MRSAPKDEAAATVIITDEGSADALEKLGKVVAGSKTVIARVGVRVFVRRGDPKPDISTVEAFTYALMNAKVIAYSDPALGGSASNYVGELLAKLDVAEWSSRRSNSRRSTGLWPISSQVAALISG